MNRRDTAQKIRGRMRVLFDLGDAAVWHNSWRAEDETVIRDFRWVLDISLPVSLTPIEEQTLTVVPAGSLFA